MMKVPKISFIVPTYNTPDQWLRECVDSLLRLPLREDEREIIIIDDGSDIPVCEIKGTHLVRQTNGGLSAARNAGLDIARGEWIEFVDADDYLLPAWNSLLPYLNDDTLDIIRIGIEHDTKEIRRLQTHEYLANENMQAAACGYIIRRKLIGTVRFTLGILHEDEEFTPRILAQNSRMLINGCRCYYYRQHSNSIMHSRDASHIQKRLDDTEGIIVRLHNLRSEILQRRIAQLTMDYIYNSLRLERSFSATHRRVRRLRILGLWPLPNIKATWQYSIFRILPL